MKSIIKKDFQGLILLPEIGLTSQFEQKFAEYFGFQMREVSVRQLVDEIDVIKNRVTAGRISPEQGAQEITDLRYVTELLENQAATVQEVVDMLHPQMSDQYRELLTNFDRVGLMMQDAGYQGFMLGPHGAKNDCLLYTSPSPRDS